MIIINNKYFYKGTLNKIKNHHYLRVEKKLLCVHSLANYKNSYNTQP